MICLLSCIIHHYAASQTRPFSVSSSNLDETDNGYFTYEIANTKRNNITEQDGRLRSDKEEIAAHDLGLSNVWEIIEKYNGTLDISYTEASFTVTVLIRNA